MRMDRIISLNEDIDHNTNDFFSDLTKKNSTLNVHKEPLDFWKLAVAPQKGEIVDSANELMRKYSQYTPGSKKCDDFLFSLVEECRERIRNSFITSTYQKDCNIEFVPSMCRGIEIALCRIKKLRRIILSPFEHPSVLSLVRWLGNLINAEVVQLHFESRDYMLSSREQEKKIVDMVQKETSSDSVNTALILSVVSYSTGLVINTKNIMTQLQNLNDSNLHIILDGAHAAGNYMSSVDIDKCWAYVISVHKWLLSPEPCGVVITHKSILEKDIPYDMWSDSFPATTTNVRVYTSLVCSLRTINKIGLDNWSAYSINLRNHFIQRMNPFLSVIGYDGGIEMSSFIAVRPKYGHFWKWPANKLIEYLEEMSVYVMVLHIEKDVPWLRVAFPYNKTIDQVNELCDVLKNTIRIGYDLYDE